jgi:hypothetical protein
MAVLLAVLSRQYWRSCFRAIGEAVPAAHEADADVVLVDLVDFLVDVLAHEAEEG